MKRERTSRRNARLVAASVLAGFVAVCACASSAFAAGLSVSPAIVEHAARDGSVGSLTVTNTTAGSLKVVVSARPWKQSLSGSVAANISARLKYVKVVDGSFTLGAGAHRAVSLRLVGKLAGGSQYGCVEVLGTPTVRSKHGVTVGYRLIDTLRLNPSHKSLRAQVSSFGTVGSGKSRELAITIHNTGNTVEPIGGTVRLKGPRGTITDTISAVRIVPGASVRTTLQSLHGVPAGTYTASIVLSSDGHTIARTSRRVKLP